jgi:hypothetical protein
MYRTAGTHGIAMLEAPHHFLIERRGKIVGRSHGTAGTGRERLDQAFVDPPWQVETPAIPIL